jgi:hypothetical protein
MDSRFSVSLKQSGLFQVKGIVETDWTIDEVIQTMSEEKKRRYVGRGAPDAKKACADMLQGICAEQFVYTWACLNFKECTKPDETIHKEKTNWPDMYINGNPVSIKSTTNKDLGWTFQVDQDPLTTKTYALVTMRKIESGYECYLSDFGERNYKFGEMAYEKMRNTGKMAVYIKDNPCINSQWRQPSEV